MNAAGMAASLSILGRQNASNTGSVHVNVWKNRLVDLGLPTGPWLREAKRALLAGAGDDLPIDIRWHDHVGAHVQERPLGELRHVFAFVPGRRLGYVTDLRYTEPNLRALAALLAGVDLLFIEAVFLDADADHAERKNHLTAAQAGRIARRLAARAVLPFHFSPRYEGRAREVRAEVLAAWQHSGE
jgi:ribonuclease Z